ncbi:MAG: hypothetical protein AAGF31_03590 [Planctomycetota bacterium]
MTLLLAQALSLDAPLDQRVQFAVVGFVVVLISLASIAVICAAAGACFRVFAEKAQSTSAPRSTVGAPTMEEVAVIVAAVAEAIEKPHRIVHIKGLTPEDLNWSSEGRMMHHASHDLPRHNR